MNVIKLLEMSQNIISKESNWTRGTLARNRKGEPIDPSDKAAVKWCAIGAIDKVCKDNMHIHNTEIMKTTAISVLAQDWTGTYMELLTYAPSAKLIDKVILRNRIIELNDERGNHNDVLKRFQHAITYIHELKLNNFK